MKLIWCISIVALLSGCSGGGGNSGLEMGQEVPPEIGGPANPEPSPTRAICYPGEKFDFKACFKLKEVDGRRLGYRDPYTDPNFIGTGGPGQYRLPIRVLPLEENLRRFKLSPSMFLDEVMSLHKDSFGIFAPKVVSILDKLRSEVRIKITSAFRSPKYNSTIGGAASWSRHLYGDAVDIVGDGVPLKKLATLCKDLGASFTDIYEQHVHCDWRKLPLPEEFFGKAPDIRLGEISQEDWARKMIDLSEIHVRGIVRRGNVVELSSTVQHQEDEDNLYRVWTIYTPERQVYTVETQKIQILLVPGEYRIQHWIGEHIYLEKAFIVQ